MSLRGAKALAGKATIDAHDGRVWFHLSAPNPRFAMMLARAACAIVLDRGNQLHGTGPFVFDQRPSLCLLQLSPSIRLVRNPYHRAMTAIQEIRFTIVPSDADGVPRKLLHALRQEWIDLTTALDPSTSQAARTASIMKVGNSTAMLFFNTARRPMNDLRLRRGIAAALDRHAIATACCERNAASFVASSVLPLSMTSTPRPRIEIARRPLIDPGRGRYGRGDGGTSSVRRRRSGE